MTLDCVLLSKINPFNRVMDYPAGRRLAYLLTYGEPAPTPSGLH